ncbi:hypothetical protein AKO1_002610, partial [Acrasis kona]
MVQTLSIITVSDKEIKSITNGSFKELSSNKLKALFKHHHDQVIQAEKVKTYSTKKDDLIDVLKKLKDTVFKDSLEHLVKNKRLSFDETDDLEVSTQAQDIQKTNIHEETTESESNQKIKILMNGIHIVDGRLRTNLSTTTSTTVEIVIDSVKPGFEDNESKYDGNQTIGQLIGAFATWDKDQVVLHLQEPEQPVHTAPQAVVQNLQRQREEDEQHEDEQPLKKVRTEEPLPPTITSRDSRDDEVQTFKDQIVSLHKQLIEKDATIKKLTNLNTLLQEKCGSEHGILHRIKELVKNEEKRLGSHKVEAPFVKLTFDSKEYNVPSKEFNAFLAIEKQKPTAILLYCKLIQLNLAEYYMPNAKEKPDGIIVKQKMSKEMVEDLSKGLRIHPLFRDEDSLVGLIGRAAGVARDHDKKAATST